ncbi:hypothetical protein Taro_020930 [Colocasia esculenta]|uniref:alpha-galactosidase n=1 Tax=Colocasia esculenta TaxID=4460 RepID=A0A843V6Q1_COLES|nr:hypothetical protein [Colocasia esculenta]
MMRSPLMFGGDPKNIDDSTFNLITNPAILEINSFSKNNEEFPFITGNKDQSRWQPPSLARNARNLKDSDSVSSRVLSLTSCEDPKAKGWHRKMYDQDTNLICWDVKEKNKTPFCLYGKRPPLASDDEIIYKERYEGNLHLFLKERAGTCMDASSNTKITSSVAKSSFMSPCKWSANQMWGLNKNGTLMSPYSGLCATIKAEKDNSNAGGIRSWIASGRRGEVYFAVFNLKPTSTVASAKVEDMARALSGRRHLTRSCNATEVWSGKSFASIGDVLSTQVNGHGCALFVILCM